MGIPTERAYRYGVALVGLSAVCLLACARHGFAELLIRQVDPIVWDKQREILMELYNATGGSNWKILSAWGVRTHCQWEGVVCCMSCGPGFANLSYYLPTPINGGQQLARPCTTEGVVSAVLLSGFGLRGTLPEAVVGLDSLEVLWLADNPGLLGSLPPELLHLKSLREVDIRRTGMSYSSSSSGSGKLAPAAPEWSEGEVMMVAHQRPCTLPEGFANSNEYVLHSVAETEANASRPGGFLACSSFLYREGLQKTNTTGAMPKQDIDTTSPLDTSESAARGDTSAPVPYSAAVGTVAQGGGVDAAGCSDAGGGYSHASALPCSPGDAAMTLFLSSPSYWGYGPCVCLRVVGSDSATASTAAPKAEHDAAVPVAAVAAAAAYLRVENRRSVAQEVGNAWLTSPLLSLPPGTSPAASVGYSPSGGTGDGKKDPSVPLRIMLGVVIPIGISAAIGWVVLIVLLCGSRRTRAIAASNHIRSCGSCGGPMPGVCFPFRLPYLCPGALLPTGLPEFLHVDAASGPSVAGACNVTWTAARGVSPGASQDLTTATAGAGSPVAGSATREDSFPGRLSATKRAKPPGSYPTLFGDCVTLVATDVEGSTELWEWQPDVMNHALTLHDRLARLTISACCGYEVTTEGDAFLVAFHDPVDAVRWALLLQSALLKLDWPPLLLEHPLCRPRPLMPVAAPQPKGGAGGASASAPLLVLFKGLSVRMGIATGVPSTVREHPVTRRMQYTGAVLRLATGIAELGSGGQVLVEPMTFKGIHNKIEELDVVEAEVQELADVVRHDTTIMGVGNPVKLETSGDADAPLPPSSPPPPLTQRQPQQGNCQVANSRITGCSGGDLTGGADFARTTSSQSIYQQQQQQAQQEQQQQEQQQQEQQQQQQQHGLRNVAVPGNNGRSSPGNISPPGSAHTGSLMRMAPQRASPDSCMLQAMQADLVPSVPQAGLGAGAAAIATASHATALLHGAVAAFPAAAGCCSGPAPPQPPFQQHSFTPNSSRLRRLADMAIPGVLTTLTGLGGPNNDSSGHSTRLPGWASAWQIPNHRSLLVMRNSGAPPASSTHNASDWNASHIALLASRGSFVSHIQTMSCSNGSRSGPHGVVGSRGLVAAAPLGGPALGDPSSPFLNLNGSIATAAGSSQSNSMMLQRTTSVHGLGPPSPGPNNLDSSATFGGTWRTTGGSRQSFNTAALPAGTPTSAGTMQIPADQEPSLDRAAVAGVAASVAVSTASNSPPGETPPGPSVEMASPVAPPSSPPSQPPAASSRRPPGPICEGMDGDDEDAIDGALLMNSAVAAVAGTVVSPAINEVGATGTINLMPRPGAATSPQALHHEIMNVEAAAYPPHVTRATTTGSADSNPSIPACRNARGSAASATLGLPRVRVDNVHPVDEDEQLYVMLLDARGAWSGYAASEGAASNGGGTGTGTGMVTNSDSRGQLRSVKGAPSSMHSTASTGPESGRRLSSGNRGFRRSDNIRAVVDSMQVESLAAGTGGTSEDHMLLLSGLPPSPGAAQAEVQTLGRLRYSPKPMQPGDESRPGSAGDGEFLGGVGSVDTGTRGHSSASPRPSISVDLASMGSLVQDYGHGGCSGDAGGGNGGRRALLATGVFTTTGGLMNGGTPGSLISSGHTGTIGGTTSTGTFGSWILQNHDVALAASGRLSLELQRLTMPSAAGLSGSLAPIDQLTAPMNIGVGSQLHMESGSCAEAAPFQSHRQDGDMVGASGGFTGSGSGPGGLFRGLHLYFKSAPQERVSRMDTSSLAASGDVGTNDSNGSDSVSPPPDATVPLGLTPIMARQEPAIAQQEVNPAQKGDSTESPWLMARLQRKEPVNSSIGDCDSNSTFREVAALKGTDRSAKKSGKPPRAIPQAANTSRRAGGLQRSAASFTARDRKGHLAGGEAGGPGHSGAAGCAGSDSGSANTSIVGSLVTGTVPGMAEFSFSRADVNRPSDFTSAAPQRPAPRPPGDTSVDRGLLNPPTDPTRAAPAAAQLLGLAGASLAHRQVWQQQQKEQQSLGGTAGAAQGPHPGAPGGITAAGSGECWGLGSALRPALPVAEAVGVLLSADDSHLPRRALHTSNNVSSTGSVPFTGMHPERHRLASASTAVTAPLPTERAAVPRLFMDQGTGGPHIAPWALSLASASTSTPSSPALLPSPTVGYRVVKSPVALILARGSASSATLESRSMEDADGIGRATMFRGGPGGCGLSSFHPTWTPRPSGMGPALVARHSAAGPTGPSIPADWTSAANGLEHNIRPGSAASTQFFYPVGPSALLAAPAVGGTTSSSSLAVGMQSPVVPAAAVVAVTPVVPAGGHPAPAGSTGLAASTSTTALGSSVMRTEEGLLAQVPHAAAYQSLSGDEALLLTSVWPDVAAQPNLGTLGLVGSLQHIGSISPSVAGSPAYPSHATLGGQQLQPYHHQQQQPYLSPHSHKLALLAAPHGNPKVLALREMLGREAGMTSVANHAAKQAKDLAEDDERLESAKTRLIGSASNIALPDSADKAFKRQHSGGIRLGMDGDSHRRAPSAVSGDMAKRSSGGSRINIATRSRQWLPYLAALRPDAVPERPESEADAASSPQSPPTRSGASAAVTRSPRTAMDLGQQRRASPLGHEVMRPVVQVPEIELVSGSVSTNALHGAREARDSDAGGSVGGDSSCEGEGGGNAGVLSALSIPRLVMGNRGSRASTAGGTTDVASGGSSPHFRRMIKRTKSRSALIQSLSSRQGNSHRAGLLIAARKGTKLPDSDDASSQRQEDHQTATFHHEGLHPHKRSLGPKREEESPSIGASASGYHPLVVIDMGVHSLSVPALDMLYCNLYDGVQVIQLLPAHLKHRAAYQPPLKSQEQLAPGFFDAPGAAQALMPYPPSQPPSFPRLSLMFIQPAGYSTVANANLEVAERSGAVFCGAVREVLQMYGAYECQEYECTFMVACSGPRVAAEAGLALQEWLLQADWPSDLLDEFESGRVVLGPSGRPLLRGFRAKVGIFTGVPLSVVPHATTGRADYFGAMVNRAARLMAGAKAGQILVDKNAGLEVLREWRQMAAAATAPTNEVGSDARSNRLTPLPLPSALRDPRVRGSSMGPSQPVNYRGSTNGSSLTYRQNGVTAIAAHPPAATGAGGVGHSTTSSGSGFYALAKTPPPSMAALQLAPSWLVPTTWPGPDGNVASRKPGVSGAGSDRPIASTSDATEPGGSGGGGMASAAIAAGVSVSFPVAITNTPGVESDGRTSVAAQGGIANATSAAGGTSALAPAAVAAMVAAAAGKACMQPRAVQVVDLGEFKLKGLQRGQPVVALQLRRMRGQQGDALLQEDVEVGAAKGGGKAHQMQRGTGLIDEVVVAVALPAVLTSTSPAEDMDAA